MGETVRNVGLESDILVIQALVPQAITDATPVLSSAIDLTDPTYKRCRFLLVATSQETTDTVHTMAFTVTESATSGGQYTASTTTGTLTASAANVTRIASFKRNAAKPFVKITATGSHADVDVIVNAVILAIKDTFQ